MFAESSKAFIFQKFAVKFYFGLSLHIFQHGSSLSLENVCDFWLMHQTWFRPQSKFTELCSLAAVVSQRKSTELCSSAAPLDHDLWYFRHRTNEHFHSILFTRKKLINRPTVAPLSSHWNQHVLSFAHYFQAPATQATNKHIERTLLGSDYS